MKCRVGPNQDTVEKALHPRPLLAKVGDGNGTDRDGIIKLLKSKEKIGSSIYYLSSSVTAWILIHQAATAVRE